MSKGNTRFSWAQRGAMRSQPRLGKVPAQARAAPHQGTSLLGLPPGATLHTGPGSLLRLSTYKMHVAVQVLSVSFWLMPREEEPRLLGKTAHSQRSLGALPFLPLPRTNSSRSGGGGPVMQSVSAQYLYGDAKDTVLGFQKKTPPKPDLILLGTRKLFQVVRHPQSSAGPRVAQTSDFTHTQLL